MSLQKITEESKIKDNAVILIVIKSIIIIFLIAWIAVSNSKNIPAENS